MTREGGRDRIVSLDTWDNLDMSRRHWTTLFIGP